MSLRPFLSHVGPSLRRSFHASARRFVQVGDRVPGAPVMLMEDSPGNKVDLLKEVSTGKALIVGVPAAFSPSCSATHIPGYIQHAGLKGAGKAFVVSVNDPFVMKAWRESLDAGATSGLRFLADPSGAFTRQLDLLFDGSSVFGGERSKRYALLLEDGVITQTFVEPDRTGVDVSRAENVLG